MAQKKRNRSLLIKILVSLVLIFLYLQFGVSSKIDFYEKNENYELRIKNTALYNRLSSYWGGGKGVEQFNNYSLKNILVKILDEDPNRIEIRGKRVNPKLDFEFEIYSSETEEWTEKIIKVIGKELNFSIYPEMIKKKVWTITINDENLLNNHKTFPERSGSKGSSLFLSKWKGTNHSIDMLSKVIADRYKKIVVNDSGSTDGYNFKLQLGFVKNLESRLKEEYGLKLTREEKETECTVIEFFSKNK